MEHEVISRKGMSKEELNYAIYLLHKTEANYLLSEYEILVIKKMISILQSAQVYA